MKNSFTAVYKKSGGWYAAWIEEFSGVNTQGKTLKEARENLKEALMLVVETNRLLNAPKESRGTIREQVAVSFA
jgi:predicted RNase H-like HicB family nuclease